ncbi:uncharacterized protein zgc:194621 [Syngnathus acus]|uniref:uncharacterized protein zgc:194621 n=1 Tax=Syngnathus acus TaxID=161584 RepID=UPI001886170F|nr:uncharacterized protein zgc:194621 [Syngnathus acus]
MPSTKMIKHKEVEGKTKPVKLKPAKLQVAPVRQNRAASCLRLTQKEAHSQTACERPSRSRSTATRARLDWAQQDAACDVKCTEDGECAGRQGRVGVQKLRIHSHKAFTVIPPNPKKRRDIQKKAKAELAALEELKLSRAMAYVNIQSSTVGGSLTLEEVRMKQQQEMMQTKRKQKVKRCDVTKAS